MREGELHPLRPLSLPSGNDAQLRLGPEVHLRSYSPAAIRDEPRRESRAAHSSASSIVPLLSPSSGFAHCPSLSPCSYSLVLPGCSGSRPCCRIFLLSAAAAAMPSVGACCRCHPVHNSFPLLRCSLPRVYTPSPLPSPQDPPCARGVHASQPPAPLCTIQLLLGLPPAHVACCCPLLATLSSVCFHAPCALSCPYLTASTHSPIAVRADQFLLHLLFS